MKWVGSLSRIGVGRLTRYAVVVLALLVAFIHLNTQPLWAAPPPGFLDKAMKSWVEQLEGGTSLHARRCAAFALGKMGSDALYATPSLVKALGHADPSVRGAAAFALGEIAGSLGKEAGSLWDSAGTPLLQALRNDTDSHVRRSAAFALGKLRPKEAFVALREALKVDAEPMVRQQAAWALGRLGEGEGEGAGEGKSEHGWADKEAVGDLSNALEDRDALVRRDAAEALRAIGQPLARSATPSLVNRLKIEKDAAVRLALLEALVPLVGPEDKALATDLLPLLQGEDADLVRAAALALGNLGGPDSAQAVPILRKLLHDRDAAYHAVAAAALANIGPKADSAVLDLGAALADPDSKTRRNAALALGRIGPAAGATVPALVNLLRREEPEEVRRHAAQALQHIGQAAEAAAPDLLRVLKNDTSPQVRIKAIMALNVHDLAKIKAIKPLEDVLKETQPEMAIVRYNAAIVLSFNLGKNASDKTLDVLQEAILNKKILLHLGSEAKVSAVGGEARSGEARIEEIDEGDGREIVAIALGNLGSRANRPEILRGLKDTLSSPSKAARAAAEKAIKAIEK